MSSSELSFGTQVVFSLVAVLPHIVRLCVVLYNRLRRPHIEYKSTVRNFPALSHTQPMVSILTVASSAETAANFIRSVRQQDYKNIELLISVTAKDAQTSVLLKKEIMRLRQDIIPDIPLFVFADYGTARGVTMVAGAAGGDILCVLNERVRVGFNSISAAVHTLTHTGAGIITIIPWLEGSFTAAYAYIGMIRIALASMQQTALLPHGPADVFTAMRAEVYYAYGLGIEKKTKEHTHYGFASQHDSAQEQRYKLSVVSKIGAIVPHTKNTADKLLYCETMCQAVFSSTTKYLLTSSSEFLQWFFAAFEGLTAKICATIARVFARAARNDNYSETPPWSAGNAGPVLRTVCGGLYCACLLLPIVLVLLWGASAIIIAACSTAVISLVVRFICEGANRPVAVITAWIISPAVLLHIIIIVAIRLMRVALHTIASLLRRLRGDMPKKQNK